MSLRLMGFEGLSSSFFAPRLVLSVSVPFGVLAVTGCRSIWPVMQDMQFKTGRNKGKEKAKRERGCINFPKR